jgi:uncharacterized lipoprotein YbaY
MKALRIVLIAAALLAVCLLAWNGASVRRAAADVEGPIMTVGTALPVPRAVGRFDYLTIDEKYRRLLAVHTSSNEMLVVNIDTGAIERRIAVGAGHGIALDIYDGKIFIGAEDGYVSQLNRRWLVENQRIYTNGPVAAVTFDPKRGRLYADHADGTEVWVIQGKTDKLLQFNVPIGKGPAFLDYDPVTDKIYQNITSTNSVAVIDPATNTVIANWPVTGAMQLRGLAIDGRGKRLFIAGANGKLAVLDLGSGQVTQTIDIAPRVDQIAYDPVANKVYCASGTGLLTVVGETSEGFGRIGEVTVPRGVHTLAIDPKTHNVWIAYGGDTSDYVMKISPPASPSPSPAALTQGIVSGTVTYVQRVALPSNAIVHVEIDDVTLEDAPMVKIASTDIQVTHQVPIAFSLPYDLAKIDPKNHYALNVTISANGTPLFLNKTRIPIITYNNPTAQIEVRVDPVVP